MNKRILLAGILALLIVPVAAFAAIYKTGPTVTISKDEVLSGNAYIAGGQVTVSASPLRDLVAAGGRLVVNGQVWGDALLLGGTVDVLELVQGDLRVAGGEVSVSHYVNGDAVMAGGNMNVLPGAVVAGDAIIAGGAVVMDGIINGETRIYGGSVSINGTVKGPLIIHAGESLSFGPNAVIEGPLTYSAPNAAAAADGAKIPEDAAFTQIESAKSAAKENVAQAALAFFSVFLLVQLIALALAVILVVSFFKHFALTTATESLGRFWLMVLFGFVTMCAVPVMIGMLFVSVVGIYVGLLVAVLYAFALLVAGLFVPVHAGALVSKLWKKEVRVNWKWGLLGVVLSFVLCLIPVIGWIAIGLLYLASLGAVVVSLYRDAKAKMA